MSLYKDVLTTAWRYTIHRPFLWTFGLFAAFVFGVGGELDRYFRFMSAIVSEDNIFNPVFWLNQHWVSFFQNMVYLLSLGQPQTWLFAILVLLALLCVLVMLSIAAGALISSAQQPAKNFLAAFEAGRKHWVDLFFLFIGGYTIIAVVIFGFGALIFSFALAREQAQQVLVMLSSLFFIPVVIISSFVLRYTANSIVLDNTHIFTALRRSLTVLRQHWLVTLEMAIVNFIIVLVTNVMVFIGLGLLFAPLYGTTLSLYASSVLTPLLSAAAVHGLAYVCVTIFVGAILSTWQWIAWALLFQRLRQEKPQSVLLYWLHYKKTA